MSALKIHGSVNPIHRAMLQKTYTRVLDAGVYKEIHVTPKRVEYIDHDGCSRVRYYRDGYTQYAVCATINEYTEGPLWTPLDSFTGR